MRRVACCSVALAALWLAGCSTVDTLMVVPPKPDVLVFQVDVAPDAAPDTADTPDAAPDVAHDVGTDAVDSGPADADAAQDVAAPVAKAQLSAKTMAFGATACGGAAPESRSITVTNSGTADVFVVLALAGSPAFALVGETSLVVAPGKSAAIEVAAQPLPAETTAGVAESATLSISTNDPDLPKLDIALERSAAGATLTVEPGLAAFGQMPLGQEGALPIKLTNTGNLPLKVALGAPSDPQFTLTWPDAPSDLALPPAGGSKIVTVHFKSGQLTPAEAVVALTTIGATCGASATSMALSGQGTAALPTISGNLDFGATACGGAAGLPQLVTVGNAGNLPFTFTAELTSGATSPYTLSFTSTTVPGGGQVDLTVAPKAVPQISEIPGHYTDTLLIKTSLPGDAPHLIALNQGAAGAIVRSDIDSIAFGAVPVVGAKSVPVLVRNTGSMPAHIVLAATGKGFSVEPSGVQELAAGATLTATATFAPEDNLPQAGSIQITVDAGDVLCSAPPAAIPVSGIGQSGGLELDKPLLDFGATNCGAAPPPQLLVLTNTGNASLLWSADLARSPSHYVVLPASTGALGPGEGVILSVSSAAMPASSPVTPNLYGETLIVTTNAPLDVPRNVPIRQTAQGAILQLLEPDFDFGILPLLGATPAWQAFHVRNVGNAAATASLLSSNAAFAVPQAQDLAPGQAQPFAVAFGPAAPGSQTASLQLDVPQSDVLCAPLPAPLTLKAQGTSGAVAYSPGSLDFGEVDCGSTAAPRQIVVRNLGAAPYHVTPQLGANPPLYAVAANPPDGTVAAGGSLTLTVTPLAMPKQADVAQNLFGDTLTLTTDVPGDAPHAIALTQTAHGAILAVSASSLDFGSAALGTAGAAPLAVTNSGNAPATLSFFASSPDTFWLPQALAVPAGAKVAVPARFSPQGLQIYSDSASISAPATVLCKPLALTSLTLAGVGVAKETLAMAPLDLHFGDNGLVACGQSAPQKTVTVTNQTATNLQLSASLGKGAWSAFSVSPGSATVEPGVPLKLTLTPKPIPNASLTTGDYYSDALILKTNAPADGKHLVSLHMTASGAILSFDKPALNLPSTKPGKQSAIPGEFRVRNAGNVAADVGLQLSDPTNFMLDLSQGTVGAGQALPLRATFAPQAPGQKTTMVSLSTAAPLCALLPQPLKMTGLAK